MKRRATITLTLTAAQAKAIRAILFSGSVGCDYRDRLTRPEINGLLAFDRAVEIAFDVRFEFPLALNGARGIDA